MLFETEIREFSMERQKEVEGINGRSQRYRNYYLSQWDFQYYLRNFIELNPVEVAEKAINIELNYSEDQIYYKMKEELSIDMEI